jgi:hypothetical protein
MEPVSVAQHADSATHPVTPVPPPLLLPQAKTAPTSVVTASATMTDLDKPMALP